MKGSSMQWRGWSSCIGYSMVAGLLALSLVVMPQAANASNAYVGCIGEFNDFSSIQAAIDDQSRIPGTRKITICAGIYAEDLLITPGHPSAYEIIGEGIGRTIITGSSGKSTAPSAPIIHVKGMGAVPVTIKNLTVDGMSKQGGKVAWGIRYERSSGIVDNVEVLNIGRCPAANSGISASEGLGITAEGDQSTAKSSGFAYTVEVLNSIVKNFTRTGILGFGLNMRLDANENSVVGPPRPRCFATNGIQVSNQALGRIFGNNIRDNDSPNRPQGEGSGIIARCAAEGSHISFNFVQDNREGIVVADSSGILVEENDVVNASVAYSAQVLGRFFGDPQCFGADAKSSADFPPTAHNVFKNNEGRDSSEYGLILISFDTEVGVPTNNTIDSNVLTNSFLGGIVVFDGTDNDFSNNQCIGSGVAGRSFPPGLC